MKKSINVLITVILVILVTTACNIPFQTSNTAASTPNLTLTALFDTSQNIPATVTPIYIVVTNTPEPVVATNTTAPTNTSEATITSTTAPTSTAMPTVPQPPPAQRTGTLMEAGYINFSPTLDGSWEDWKDYTTLYPASSVVYGGSNWTGADDLEASFGAVWDYDYLYIGVKVYDDKYVQNATGVNLFKGDSIEILLDTNFNGDYYSQTLSSDDYQLGISAGKNTAGSGDDEAYLWYPSSKAGDRSSKVDVGMMTEDGLYRIEARIPWSVFGVDPAKGMHMGIAVSVSDDDSAGTKIQQTMVSSSYRRVLSNPVTWGEMVFTK